MTNIIDIDGTEARLTYAFGLQVRSKTKLVAIYVAGLSGMMGDPIKVNVITGASWCGLSIASFVRHLHRVPGLRIHATSIQYGAPAHLFDLTLVGGL